MSAIVVCSGKGTPGATFVAVNLAAAVGRAGEETILLDLDPSGGDVCYLGLDPRRGLYPLLRMEGGVPRDERLMAEAEERSGVHIVGGQALDGFDGTAQRGSVRQEPIWSPPGGSPGTPREARAHRDGAGANPRPPLTHQPCGPPTRPKRP